MLRKLAVCAIILTSCTSTQRDWRNNTSLDVAIGGNNAIIDDSFTSLGASYYLDYGISFSVGVWNNYFRSVGTYWGFGWSITPFAKD